jgi:hypothetical protein
MEKEEKFTASERRITLDLPIDFYFRITKIREDFIRNGKKISLKGVIQNALNSYSKELGYDEIECQQ